MHHRTVVALAIAFQAKQAAELTRKAVSRSALLGFFALAFGGLTSWFGGRMGAVHPIVTGLNLGPLQRQP